MKPGETVLIFATQHMPAGGIESHLQEFCLQLSRTGVIMDLVITDARMDPGTREFFRKTCRRVHLGSYGKSYLRGLWLFGVGLLLRGSRYTAVYTNGQGESIFRLRKMFRAGRWLHHHHTSGDAEDQATWGPQYRRALAAADTVIACSRHNASMMEAALGREIRVIPCFSRKPNVARRNSGAEEKIRFGYYGRLIPEKGIDLLCRLSTDPLCRHLEFHIWGAGEAYPETFFAAFPAVRYHGSFRGLDQLENVLGAMDAFLLLSRHPEGLPVCLLEVMAAGIPWLATDRGGIRDIACDPLLTRVISPGAAYPEIRAAVLALADDLRAGRLSGDSPVRWYEENFSSSGITSRWRNCLGIQSHSA